jgi:hypothetical protein
VVRVKYDELLFGYEFVNSSPEASIGAYVSLGTGEVYCNTGELAQDELPADLNDPTRYLPIPEKGDLDLGARLVFRFVETKVPGRYDEVRDIFRHKGAYHRFKRLMESEGALDKWFAYEAAAVETVLREWCEENGLEVEDSDDERPAKPAVRGERRTASLSGSRRELRAGAPSTATLCGNIHSPAGAQEF